jgi:Golgi nucleoside diphosphatase
VWVNAAVVPRIEEIASEENPTEMTWSRGIIIDAGSSGSRVYLYQWLRHSGNPDDLLKIEQMRDEKGDALVRKQEPGISTYVDDPQKAFASLEPLLNFASSHIPLSSHKDTLLFILATAGVRLVTQEKQEKLLNVLRTNIRSRYSFRLPDSHVEVLTGKLEGGE